MKYPFTQISPIPKWLCGILCITMMYLIFGLQVQASQEDWPVYEADPLLLQSDENLVPLPCFGSVNVSLGTNGMALLTPKMFISDPSLSLAAMKVEVIETGRNIVDCNDIGKVRSAKVRDTITNNSCWAVIKVEDKLMPSLICENDTFQCTEDPFDIRYDALIATVDNCDLNPIIHFGLSFQKLNCDPLISSIMHVQYTVKDKYGNAASCLKDVYFEKIPLDSIQFPDDDTTYCNSPGDTGAPGYQGEPVSAMCDLIATHLDDTIPVCGGMYKISRRWTVMDWCLRTSITQVQEILVSDTGRPSLTCPPDSLIILRGQNCLVNYTVPAAAAIDDCSPSELLYYLIRVDSLYTVRPGDIIGLTDGPHTLDYIVLDPCGNSDTCTRKIEVQDKSAPSLVCPSKLIVALDANGEGYVDIAYLDKFMFYSDNCGVYDISIRRMTDQCDRPQDTIFRNDLAFCCQDLNQIENIVVKVEDQWGNANFCMIPIEVTDKIAPIIACTSIIRNIQSSDSAKILAKDLLLSTSGDNCTLPGQLIISFDSNNPNDTCRYISCSQHKPFPDSLWPFTIFVKDLSGNLAQCTGSVDVNDPSGFCNSLVGNKLGITGLIKSTSNIPHENVTVNEMMEHKEGKTDYKGVYEIKGYIEKTKVEVFPYCNENWLEGLSTLDIVRIQKHLLGVDPFTNVYEWIAADVNKDGKVSSFDISILRKLILGSQTEVKGNTSYRFIPENYAFKDLEFPLNDSLPINICTEKLTKDFKANFISLKVGDVSGAKGNITGSIHTRNRYYSVGTQNINLSREIKHISTFTAEQEFTLDGYQLQILFDPEYGYPERLIEFTGSLQGKTMSEDQYSIHNDKLHISFTNQFPKRFNKGDKMFAIVWNTIKECKVSEIIRETAFNNNEIYTSAYSSYPLILHINNQAETDLNPEIENFKLAPNPFTEDCTLSFISNMEVDSYLEVLTSDGKIIVNKWVPITKGSNSILISRSDLQGQGLYHYKFMIGDYLKKGKIILTK